MSSTLVETDLAPVYILRRFAWDALKANTDMTEADYGGLVPIVALAEEPDLSDTTKPYLVYGYALDTTKSLYAVKSGSMTFAIYDQDFRRLTKIMNILEATFERQDDSASELNKYSSQSSFNGAYLGIRFGSVSIGFVEGGTPEDSEGGRQSGLLNIRFDYFVDYNVKRFVNGSWV